VPEGRLIDLKLPASSASADNPEIAGARIQPPAKLFVFGKSAGETFVRARDDSGKIVALVRVDVSGQPP
jgi:Flp pilus assembly secretin CpaC